MEIPPATAHNRTNSIRYISIILFIAVIVIIAGIGMIRQQKQFLMSEKRKELSTIADIKTTQILEWRREQIAEGTSIRANNMLAIRAGDYLAGRDQVKIRQEFKFWLATLVNIGGYSKGILFSTNGEVISSNKVLADPPSLHYLDHVAAAAKGHDIILSDFHRDQNGAPYDIDITIPIMSSSGAHSRCVAVLVLDIEPERRLYPLIKSWPTTSTTAENLLVMREGDSVVYLNQLRHTSNTPGAFLLPYSSANLPAARATRGPDGSFEGTDYRGVPVLSAVRKIPGTSWGLVTKIDIQEVLAPLSHTIWYVTTAATVVLISVILGLFLWIAQQKAEAFRKQVEREHIFNAELKASEDALTRSRDYYMSLLDNFPALVWRSGANGSCDYFNRTWLDFTGRSLEQELGDGWKDDVHPDDLGHCVSSYLNAFHARVPFIIEYRLRYNDGSYHWISDHGTPYRDQNGAFAGYIGSCYDIELQKKAESELQIIHSGLERQIVERTKDLIEINSLLRSEIVERKQLEQKLLSARRLESIGQIAGGVAHEVRNPLNAILTITEALFKEQEIGGNPEYAPYIHHIRTQVNRLVILMNDLLDLGRTIPATNLQPTSLYELCRETVELWKSTGLSKNKRALLSSDNDDISIKVISDVHKLQQVFFNLLENAGYHSLEGGIIMIQLTRNTPDLPDGMAAVQVIDQGSGIAEDKLSKVFDPFYTDRKGGTGLGLALVKHYIENMHGTVRIWNNTPQPGCTAEVCIPLYREDSK